MRQFCLKALFVLSFAFFNSVNTQAMTPVVLDGSSQQALWDNLYLALDHRNEWSVEQVKNSLQTMQIKPGFSNWQRASRVDLLDDSSMLAEGSGSENPNIIWEKYQGDYYPAPGYLDATIWAAVRVQNDSSEMQPRLISLEHTALDDVEMFVIGPEGALQYYRSGNLVKPADRWNLSLVPTGALVIPPKKSAVVLLRVKSQTSIQLPLYLWKSREFSAQQRSFIAAEMLFYGLVISLVISQLIEYVTRRNTFSLWYVFTGLSIILLFSSMQGVGSIFIWGAWGTFARDVFVYSLGLLAFSIVGLGLQLLRIKNDFPLLYRITTGCQYFILSWVLWLFLFGYKTAVISLMIYGVLLTFAVNFVGISHWYRQTRAGRYFIVSWGLFFIAGCLTMLAKLNVIEWSVWYLRLMQFATIIQLLIFYYFQATSIVQNQEELIMQKDEAIALEKNYTLRLKHEVEESQAALKMANRQLEEFHIIDGLSGAFNRAYFNREFPIEVKRATREQFHLSLVIIDIVELNIINERYGHLAGDKCIRFLSEVIATVAQRDTDWHARFSDDSFVLVLPTTNAIDAQALVQKIIEQTYHDMPIRQKELSFRFKIKLAFVSGIPNREISSSDWIDYLCSALNRVKQMEDEDFWSYEF